MTPLNPPVPKRRKRSSKYTAEFCDIIFEVAERGGHKAEMSKLIGINEDTFTEWCKIHPEFGKAWRDSKTISKAWWEDFLMRGAMGLVPGFNFKAAEAIMFNKFRDEYKRHSTAGGTHVEITNNTLHLQDPRSLDDQIAQKLASLNSLGIQITPAPLLIEQTEEEDYEEADED